MLVEGPLGAFLDVEKEPFGFGDRTLFVYDRASDRIGDYDAEAGVFRVDHVSPGFFKSELVTLAYKEAVERIYLGARETEVSPDLVDFFVTTFPRMKVTFETARLDVAEVVQNKWRDFIRVTVVWRTEFTGVVKLRHGFQLTFTKAQQMWKGNSAILGDVLRRRHFE